VATPQPGAPAHRPLRYVAVVGLGPILVAAVGVGLYFRDGAASRAGTALLLTAAAVATGGFVGFLFGIPRSVQAGGTDEAATGRYGVNTNLEQISDWLTKILVGVGLVQLGALLRGGSRLVAAVSVAFGTDPSARVVAGSVLIFGAIAGFLIGYVTTRTRLTLIFAQFDRGELESLVDHRLRTRLQRDGDAIQLVMQQREENEPEVDPERLRAALAAASPGGRAQVLVLAQDWRRRAWRQAAGKGQTHRLVAVFRALAEVDPDRHRHWGNLGFALKDADPPDLAGARSALDRAIELRGHGAGAGKETYELARALVRVRQLGDAEPDAGTREAIRRDVAAACRDEAIRERIQAATAGRRAGQGMDAELRLLRPYLPARQRI
jgi:hypothetical protein